MEKQIRILHVLGRLDRGGAETMVMNLYRNIDRSKIQFDFIIHTNENCDYNDEIYKLGGKIYNVPRYTGRNHFAYKKAWQDFFNSHPEYKVVHGHMRSTAAIYLKIAKKNGLIAIAHSHSTASRGSKVEQIAKNIMQFPIRFRADNLFACSDEAGKWLFGEKAIKKDNYQVIKNAIDVEKYVFNKDTRNEMRKSLNIEKNFVIGHVGSFTHPKNHKFLIDVFYEVQKQEKNAILMLVGDGQLNPQIQKQIEMLGIKEKVLLAGVVPNVNNYLQAMDVFVFPSIFEGLGIAVIEAQAAGLKTIVSDTVPREAFITDLILPLSLESKIDTWKRAILDDSCVHDRKNTMEEISSNGYCISKSAERLSNLYFQLNRIYLY
jgi:glycosyltransferase involved in cell wall biosynthesis